MNRILHPSGNHRPVLLIIMDGVAIGNQDEFDAVYQAKTPHLDALYQSELFCTLKAHGTAVGMPSDSDIGNSEVGHNTLGAGRVIPQGASLVKTAIDTRSLFRSDSWTTAIQTVSNNDSTLHLIGLLSDGNVHAHLDHTIALIQAAADAGVSRCRLHSLLDGRDVAPQSALGYLDRLDAVLAPINTRYDYRIASGGGRMRITMDRYNADWAMVQRGWNTHVLGLAPHVSSARDAIEAAYVQNPNITDQDIEPFVVADAHGPIGCIHDGDAVLLTNFRGDRAIELSQCFDSDATFDRFDRQRVPDVFFAGMMQYDGDLAIPQHFLVPPPQIEDPLSHYLCGTGIRSFAISETQKYGHVTYFWNGNNSGYVDPACERYIEILGDPRPFEAQPAMQSVAITDAAIDCIRSGDYAFGRINFPNGDMIGHTGNLAAAIASVEAVDACVNRLVDAMRALGGITVILADHGNADAMGQRDATGRVTPITAHTCNPVPCCIVGAPEFAWVTVEQPGLSHIASTLCVLMGYEAPAGFNPALVTRR